MTFADNLNTMSRESLNTANPPEAHLQRRHGPELQSSQMGDTPAQVALFIEVRCGGLAMSELFLLFLLFPGEEIGAPG